MKDLVILRERLDAAVSRALRAESAAGQIEARDVLALEARSQVAAYAAAARTLRDHAGDEEAAWATAQAEAHAVSAEAWIARLRAEATDC